MMVVTIPGRSPETEKPVLITRVVYVSGGTDEEWATHGHAIRAMLGTDAQRRAGPARYTFEELLACLDAPDTQFGDLE